MRNPILVLEIEENTETFLNSPGTALPRPSSRQALSWAPRRPSARAHIRPKEISKGEGADVVIDCVGMEASPAHGQGGLVSAVKEKVMPAERTYVLDQAIKAVRPCGVVSVPGVYGGPVSVNMGSIVQKGLRLCSGQTHVKRYLEPLTKLIQEKKVDTTFLITHRSTDLAEGPDLYQTFKTKKNGCVKVVFHPA
jgi:threonine dehydrogenase-like Zn-dependent dehydrogenase